MANVYLVPWNVSLIGRSLYCVESLLRFHCIHSVTICWLSKYFNFWFLPSLLESTAAWVCVGGPGIRRPWWGMYSSNANSASECTLASYEKFALPPFPKPVVYLSTTFQVANLIWVHYEWSNLSSLHCSLQNQHWRGQSTPNNIWMALLQGEKEEPGTHCSHVRRFSLKFISVSPRILG